MKNTRISGFIFFCAIYYKGYGSGHKQNNNNNNRPTERLKYSIFHTRNWSKKNGNHMKFGVVFILLCVSWWQKIYMNDMKKTIVLNFCISMWHVCFIFCVFAKMFYILIALVLVLFPVDIIVSNLMFTESMSGK